MSERRSEEETLADQRKSLTQGLSGIRGSRAVFHDDEAEEDYWAEIDVRQLRVKELRAALEARGLSTEGPKRVLQARLQQSVHEEKEEELEYLAMVEAARRAEAALEESGSVYTTGLNRKGQLGHGDTEDRTEFTVVKRLRGKGVKQVSAAGDITLALAENGNVFTWGDIGNGGAPPKGRAVDADDDENDHAKEEEGEAIGKTGHEGLSVPHLVEVLQGEGIQQICAGPNHCGAVSDGGDLYMWGDGTRGQCGTGLFSIEDNPKLIENLQDSLMVKYLCVGQTHSLILGNKTGEIFAFGFSNSGKLGLGVTERKGVKAPSNKYFPVPIVVPSLQKVKIHLIACSANHSAAIAEEGLFTWGSGDGGRLGHGDNADRHEPCLVKALQGSIVIDISLGFWHSGAIIQVPPCINGGWLYTWGSGYHGQLAQGDQTCVLIPAVSHVCVDMRMLFLKIESGPTHCLGISIDGDLYSWGSNTHGELGREMFYEEDDEREYSPIPGFVEGFNSIVNRVGRGDVISFSCGRSFSIVATSKYTGETEEEAKIREEEEALAAEEEAYEKELQEAEKRKKQAEGRAKTSRTEWDPEIYMGMGCAECDDCPGFDPNLFRATECKECKHKRNRHNKPKKKE